MKRGMLFTVFIGLNAACGVALGDDKAAATARVGLPWDWSHTWVILNPDLPEEAMAKGEYAEWLRRWEDPRFKHAVIRKADHRLAMQEEAAAQAKARTVTTRKEPPQRPPPAEPPKPPAEPPSAPRTGGRRPPPSGSIHRDWSNLIGSGSGTAGNFPAKYSFDINAAPDCVNDFIVVPMDAAGNPGAGTVASGTGSVSAGAGTGTITLTNGANVLTLTQSTTQNTGFFFQANANPTLQAVNIAAAINRNGGVVGVASTSSGATVTVSTTRVGPQGNNVQLTKSGVANFTWGAANLSGGSGTPSQGNLVAFNQLYKTTCDDTANPPVRRVPNTLFYYNTSTGGVVDTSPVLSMDGTQIAFTERNGTTVSLVLLKWSVAGSPGAPFTPPLAASAAAYLACTAPGMYKMSLGADNAIASPYYDYAADAIYVGDAAGRMHKFTGVFNGTPAPAGAPWPVTVSAGNQMSNAVYDQATGLVFVGSARGVSSGGQLHSISSAGTVVSTGQLATNIVAGQADAGVQAIQLDSFAQRVYAYVGSDTTTACSNKPCTAVYQFPTNSSISGLTSPRAQIGQGNAQNRFIRTGAFDQAYWNSTPTSPTGFLYVCGSLSDQASERPTLWRIPVTANVMGAAVLGPKLVQNPSAECSPITQVMNGSNEYLFVSVPAGGNQTGCSGSCLYMYRLNGIVWNNNTAPTAGFNAPGGTSGIIIDNISSVVGNSQVYYMTLSSPGTIVQASQAALQ